MLRLRNRIDLSVLREMFQLVWSRITLSRLTTVYFVLAVFHCIIQVLFQAQAFQTNASAANLITTILETANATSTGFALLDGDLIWCQHLPSNGKQNGDGCDVIWKGKGSNAVASNGESNDSSSSDGDYSTTDSITFSSSAESFGQVATAVPSIQPTGANQAVNPASPSTPPQVTVTRFVRPSPTSSANADVIIHDKRDAQPPHDPLLTSDPLFSKAKVSKRFPQRHHDPLLTTDPLLSKSDIYKRHINVLITSTSSSTTTDPNGKTVVTITGLPNAPAKLTLDRTCLITLNWPLETLENTIREDIVFIVFHIWVLSISVVGLLNESIPHMLASFVTHIAVTAWSAFQLVQTRSFQANFNHFVTSGACAGENLLPTYWRDRSNAEIPSAAFNSAALLISAFLTYKLIKTYNWATFKRIGASRTISRIYKIVLSLSVVLQLSVFFIVVSMALWIDQLCNGVIGRWASNMTLYRVIYVLVLLFLVPWIVIGWRASRREQRTFMSIFLLFNVVLIGGWASMFAAITFRWTFIQWRFFSVISTIAVALTVLTLILGIMSRRNFGNDLPKYLNAQSKIEDDEEFVSATDDLDFKGSDWGSEKISFPSHGPVPTFGSTFGSNPPSRNPSDLSTSSSNPFSSSQGSFSSGGYGGSLPLTNPASVHLSHGSDGSSPVSFNSALRDQWERDMNRISISSAQSARTYDHPRPTNSLTGTDVGMKRKGSGGSGGGRKLVKRPLIE